MLVDVMVPAYGDGRLVRETVASVVDQSDPRWRLTVVDDGASVPDQVDLDTWIAGLDDDRVRVLRNDVRLGINRNFQRCVDEATEDLVVVLGADDRLLPDFVARVLDAARRHPDVDFLHTGARVIDAEGRPALPLADRIKRAVALRAEGVRETGGEELATSLLVGNWMYFPSVVFRREVVQRHGFRIGYDIVLDLDLYLRLLVAGHRCLLFAEPGIEYRRHAASLSSSGAGDGSRFAEEIAYFAEVEAVVRPLGWARAARAARLHPTSRLHALVRSVALLAAGHPRAAAEFVRLGVLGTTSTVPRAPEGAGRP